MDIEDIIRMANENSLRNPIKKDIVQIVDANKLSNVVKALIMLKDHFGHRCNFETGSLKDDVFFDVYASMTSFEYSFDEEDISVIIEASKLLGYVGLTPIIGKGVSIDAGGSILVDMDKVV